MRLQPQIGYLAHTKQLESPACLCNPSLTRGTNTLQQKRTPVNKGERTTMAGPRSLALKKLFEVSSVVAPMLERLCTLHAQGEAHGNMSLATVTIRVIEPADGTLHLLSATTRRRNAPAPCASAHRHKYTNIAHTLPHRHSRMHTHRQARIHIYTYEYTHYNVQTNT